MAAYDDWTLGECIAFRKELADAVASGTFRVRYADRDVTYRSLDEMRQTLGMLDRAIAAKNGVTRTRRIDLYSTKGFS